MTKAKKDKTLLMLAKLIKLHCRETGRLIWVAIAVTAVCSPKVAVC